MVFRGVHDSASAFQIRNLEDLKPGLRYTEPGFTSTSSSKPIAAKKFAEQHPNKKQVPRVITIELEPNTPALPMKAIGLDAHEKEVLLPRDLTYEVVEVRGKNVKVKIVQGN